MERDVVVMIYGAIMGVVGSILTSILTALFQLWLDRREYRRRQTEEHDRRLRQIHLPTDEDVRLISQEHQNEQSPETARTSASAGAVLLSLMISSTLVFQTRDPFLGFSFAAALGFLFTRRLTRYLRRR
jgi:predicted PurR-regulated permease PerM